MKNTTTPNSAVTLPISNGTKSGVNSNVIMKVCPTNRRNNISG